MKPQFDNDESLGAVAQRYRNLYLAGLVSGPIPNGAAVAYPKTAVGVLSLLAASPDFDRDVVVIVCVDEVFANGGGTQTTFKIGTDTSDVAFAATAVFTAAALRGSFIFTGKLAKGDRVIVTAVAATSTGTGGISVVVLPLRVY